MIGKAGAKAGVKAGKTLAKAGAKALVATIGPLLPIIAIAVVIVILVFFIVASIYSAFSSTGTLGKARPDPVRDAALLGNYERLCGQYNAKDTWLVNESPSMPYDGNSCESYPDSPYYPGAGFGTLGYLGDTYGNDYKLKLLWGQAHGAAIYYAFAYDLSEVNEPLQEKVVDGLHPYYYYKQSYVYVTSCDDDGCEITRTVQYLLVEAYTIQGHFQYHYQWETIVTKNGSTITREVFRESQQILPNKWQRLEDWIVEEYEVSADPADMALARLAVWEAGVAYQDNKEWLAWLNANGLGESKFVSYLSIPADLLEVFRAVGEEYGIPWWFLAAVAYEESKFDVYAHNASGAYGLMQVMPFNWEAYAPTLGYDLVADKDNPKAQVAVAAYMLYSLGLKDVTEDQWESDAWKSPSYAILMQYGGWNTNTETKAAGTKYINSLWAKAGEFKATGSMDYWWPVPSLPVGTITANNGFGARGGEHQGIDIPGQQGVPVVSATSGVVYIASRGDNGGYGNVIYIRDGFNEYRYAHLSRIDVSAGQTVTAGQQIGAVGNTGNSFGPHLHFEIRVNFVTPVDPLIYFQ